MSPKPGIDMAITQRLDAFAGQFTGNVFRDAWLLRRSSRALFSEAGCVVILVLEIIRTKEIEATTKLRYELELCESEDPTKACRDVLRM